MKLNRFIKNQNIDPDDSFEKASERQRIEQLLLKHEASVRAVFRDFIKTVKSEGAMKRIREFLEADELDNALRFVESHIVRMSNVLGSIFTNTGQSEVDWLKKQMKLSSSIALEFNPTDPQAMELMRANQLNFIREFTKKQREATRFALITGLREGLGTVETADLFRDSIGLTQSQLNSVGTYRSLLLNNDRAALDRALRDRRFDNTVERVINENDLLTHAQIDKMVDAYRNKFIDFRAHNISRTETHKVVEQARDESLRQSVLQGDVPSDRIRRVWVATKDKRTRDTHWAMNGQIKRYGQPFVSPSGAKLMQPGDPKAPPEEIINCRCTVTIRIR